MSRALLIAGATLAVLAAATSGCGEESGAEGRSSRLVDFSKKPPYVNSLEIDDRTDDFLLTTNRGFFRVDPDGDGVRRVRGKLTVGSKRATLGTFLELNLESAGHLVGSGHPDQRTLPQFLGFLRSDDGGRTWRSISRMADADLHKIVFAHGRMYAWDAVLSALLISEDDGRSFTEHFTPRGLMVDFEVDPEDPQRVVWSNDDQLFRSEDEGEGWRPIVPGEGIRLAWPEADRLYRADRDGSVSLSDDGGDSWDPLGEVDGEPYVLKALSSDELYLALSDGTIMHTTDGAKNWEEVFRP